jgi:glycerol uptake operon antiterminator
MNPAIGEDAVNILVNRLADSPVIAAIRSKDDLDYALESSVEVLFILDGDVSSIGDVVSRIKKANKLGLLHIDLITGLAKDESAVKFLSRSVKADGIVSTRANLISKAKNEGLLAVQRIFLLDSASFDTGIKMVHQSGCDAVEVMPGIVFSELAGRLIQSVRAPFIAGGLVTGISRWRKSWLQEPSAFRRGRGTFGGGHACHR